MNAEFLNGPILLPIVVVVTTFSFVAVVVWLGARQKEREAYYRNEMLKKMAEGPTGGANAIEFLREQERIGARRRREGQQLGGMITIAVGIAMLVFLKSMLAHDSDPAAQQAYLVGLIPFLIGVVLLTHSFFFAAKE